MTDRTDPTPAPTDAPPERVLDAVSLKALAHPLRVEIFDALSAFGPATASRLAERLGESSGATSYHLRQLERHGFVEEDPDRGTGRERWWRRVPGGVAIRSGELADTPAAKQIAESLALQWHRRRQREIEDFLLHGEEHFSSEWMNATTISSSYLQVTKEELQQIVDEYHSSVERILVRYRDRAVVEGSEAVLLNFNAFPVPGRSVPNPTTAHIPTTDQDLS